jgi:hypothetical protein
LSIIRIKRNNFRFIEFWFFRLSRENQTGAGRPYGWVKINRDNRSHQVLYQDRLCGAASFREMALVLMFMAAKIEQVFQNLSINFLP